MTSNEKEVLKIIWQNKGKASLFKIARELRLSTDYCRLICGSLIRNRVIKFLEGQYKVTDLGKKELEKFGLIEKKEKVIKPQKKTAAKREKKVTITKLSGLTPKLIKALKQKGFRTLEDVAVISVSRLMEIDGLELKKAAEMINEARDKLRREGKEYLWE